PPPGSRARSSTWSPPPSAGGMRRRHPTASSCSSVPTSSTSASTARWSVGWPGWCCTARPESGREYDAAGMRRAQVTVGVLAALVFGAAIVAAGAMQSAGTTTAAARRANFAEAVSKTMQIKNGRFSQDVTVAGRKVTLTGTFDFQHSAVEFHEGNRVVRAVNRRLYVSGLPIKLPSGVVWV